MVNSAWNGQLPTQLYFQLGVFVEREIASERVSNLDVSRGTNAAPAAKIQVPTGQRLW